MEVSSYYLQLSIKMILQLLRRKRQYKSQALRLASRVSPWSHRRTYFAAQKKDIHSDILFCERETAHEVRGTSALRGPERSGEDRTSRHVCASKKDDVHLHIAFFSRARDGDRTRDPLLGKEVLHR